MRVRVVLSNRERAGHIENVARVLMQLSWLAQKQFAQAVAVHQLTMPQFFTLAVLVKAGQHCSMNFLAEATHQDAATMTGVVDRLERLGLVERARSLEDRRVVLVIPTPQGVALVGAIKQGRDAMMAELFEGLDDDTLRNLSADLESLWQAMETRARGC